MLALVKFEAGVCECGFHESFAETDPVIQMETKVCPVCRGAAKQMRMLAEEDAKRDGDDPPPEKIRAADGRSIYLRVRPTAAD